ncbi:hypothetical protein PAMP_016080 [Pampus punctatissimus]
MRSPDGNHDNRTDPDVDDRTGSRTERTREPRAAVTGTMEEDPEAAAGETEAEGGGGRGGEESERSCLLQQL